MPVRCRDFLLPLNVLGQALFNSRTHGQNWATFFSRIVSQGPTLIVIEDNDGYVFGTVMSWATAHADATYMLRAAGALDPPCRMPPGGFASSDWKRTAKYYGSADCFVFSLKPTMALYTGTTVNDHYQYFNTGTETLANGLVRCAVSQGPPCRVASLTAVPGQSLLARRAAGQGFGGQFGYMALWLAEGLETGHSKANPRTTTYNSPRLSKEEEFRVRHVEVRRDGRRSERPWIHSDEAQAPRAQLHIAHVRQVWGLKEPEIDPNRETGPSILDKHKEDQVLLEWAGREQQSKGIRDRAPDEAHSDED